MSCRVCSRAFGDLDLVAELLCGHAVHSACLTSLLALGPALCPACGREAVGSCCSIYDAAPAEFSDSDNLSEGPEVPEVPQVSSPPAPPPPPPPRLGPLDTRLMHKVTRRLPLDGWLAFYAVCHSWHRDRPRAQYYALATPRADSAGARLRWVAERNDVAWLRWFLERERQHFMGVELALLVADLSLSRPRVAKAFIEFDWDLRCQAEACVAALRDARDVRAFCDQLVRRRGYRLPYCRALLTRLGVAWSVANAEGELLARAVDAVRRL